jgi:hypothetical protein
MDIVYIDNCRYEIQEQKEVPVWCNGIYRSISRTDLYAPTKPSFVRLPVIFQVYI